MKIAIGADHAGYRYKEILKPALSARGHQVVDFGTNSPEMTDYPPIMHAVAESVARKECDRGIVLGGSGNGEAIVANRVRGIRATVAWSVDSAHAGRAHNDSNVLALGERFIAEGELLKILDEWLNTAFEGGRHKRRIDLIDAE
jgi:ribose 5-phosphate isomerase B